MMDDSELRHRFAQLREADREGAPGFAETLAAKIESQGPATGRTRARRSRRATPRVRPLVIGAAAGVAIAAIGLMYSRSVAPSSATPEIVTWRAPTDVLLRTPGTELLTAMPALGASVLDKMIPTLSEKGA
jgi:anti-sigma factor RsiW